MQVMENQELIDFSNRMNEICDEKGIPPKGQNRQHELGKIFDVSQKGSRKWLEAEGFPSMSMAIRIAKWANVNIQWLLIGSGSKYPHSAPEPLRAAESEPAPYYSHPSKLNGDYILVPRKEVRAGMGSGQIVFSEQITDSLAFRADWIKHEIGANPKNLVLINAVGDSMEPTLRSGDLLLIDLAANQIRHDAIYVIALDDELLAKRMQRLVNGTVIVKSDNPLYREQSIEQEKLDALRIIGRVVWVCRKV